MSDSDSFEEAVRNYKPLNYNKIYAEEEKQEAKSRGEVVQQKSEWRKNKIGFKGPFRAVMCGRSCSGKTSACIDWIENYQRVDAVWIYAKQEEVDLWSRFITKRQKLEEELNFPPGTLVRHGDQDDFPSLDEVRDNQQNVLIVIDDFQGDKVMNQKLYDHFKGGRKNNFSYIYLAQGWTETPMVVRDNSDIHMIFLLGQGASGLSRYYSQLATSLSLEEIKVYYDYVIERGKQEKVKGYLTLAQPPGEEDVVRYLLGKPIYRGDVKRWLETKTGIRYRKLLRKWEEAEGI